MLGSSNPNITRSDTLVDTTISLGSSVSNTDIFAWEAKIPDESWTELAFFSGYSWNRIGLLSVGTVFSRNNSNAENTIPARAIYSVGNGTSSFQAIFAKKSNNGVLIAYTVGNPINPRPLRIYKVG